MSQDVRRLLLDLLSASPYVDHADEVDGAGGKRLVRLVYNGEVFLVDYFCIGPAHD